MLFSHDLALVRHVADKVVVMYLGKVMEQGRVDEVFGGGTHPYTEALLSAIRSPKPDEVPRERIRLTGETPSPVNVPAGCRFATRCHRKVGAICDTVPPPIRRMSATHEIACHIEEIELSAKLPVFALAPSGQVTFLTCTPAKTDPRTSDMASVCIVGTNVDDAVSPISAVRVDGHVVQLVLTAFRSAFVGCLIARFSSQALDMRDVSSPLAAGSVDGIGLHCHRPHAVWFFVSEWPIMAALFIVCESWINLYDERNQGTYFSLYMMMTSLAVLLDNCS